MPQVQNVLAGVAVSDLRTAATWYEKLLDRDADTRPMPEVIEWHFDRGGWLQVFSDQQRAGSSSVTLTVDDLESTLRSLQDKGIDVLSVHRSEQVDTAILQDPDRNQVVIAHAKTDRMAS
jgi:predicted enzyme related to lactoylglutathione lyase